MNYTNDTKSNMEMFKAELFKGQVVLVSGGGSGLGFEMSKQFLQYGAKVFIASRNENRLQQAAEKLSEYGNCEYYPLDIRDLSSIRALAGFIEQKAGKLDVLINNAGGQFPSPAEKITPNGWNAVINTNLSGTWHMTQVMAKNFFIPQKSGCVIHIIINIMKGFPGIVHSAAARAGIDSMTKTLAVEWSPYNIRMNAVAPGIIQTSGIDTYPPDYRNKLLYEYPKKIPFKRLGEPADVANAALFLASPMAGYITGETIYIDGGWRLWGDIWELPDLEKTAI